MTTDGDIHCSGPLCDTTVAGAGCRLTGIDGGIGSGKSVVSDVLRAMGYKVYDCDSRAKAIMDGDAVLRHRIACALGDDVLRDDGSCDRQAISRKVFSDKSLLTALNRLVHGAVRDDLRRWCTISCPLTRYGHLFVESAILYQSGLDRMVSDIWTVRAPEDVRLRRVMSRNGLSAAQVRARIASQTAAIPDPHPPTAYIDNDGIRPLLPQILRLLDKDR